MCYEGEEKDNWNVIKSDEKRKSDVFGFRAGERPVQCGKEFEKLCHLWSREKSFPHGFFYHGIILTIIIDLPVLASASYSKVKSNHGCKELRVSMGRIGDRKEKKKHFKF